MALAVKSLEQGAAFSTPELLSDERIEELLKEAETRLRAKAGLEPISANDDVLALDSTNVASQKRIHFPKLEHNLDRNSYLKNHNGIAKASPDLMVPAEQRKMADGLRAVAKESDTNKKVVRTLTNASFTQHEEILSQILLDAHQRLILRLPCFHESH